MNRQIINEGMKTDAFKEKQIFNTVLYKTALDNASKKINYNLSIYGDKFPDSSSINNKYPLNVHTANPGDEPVEEKGRNLGWTTGFWTGMLWLMYETTSEHHYLEYLDSHIDTFLKRVEEDEDCKTHDLGFLYSLSCVAACKLRGDEKAKKASLLAADLLMESYVNKAGIFQAWGDMKDPTQSGRMIIDCLMNLSLLYWASEVTGNEKYSSYAYLHAKNALAYIVREDGTTFHTFFFDVNTGEPRFGKTFQGYSDDSCWARGEAWGIYGFTLSYLYTKDIEFLDMSKTLANYFLNRTPKDLVAYWDLIFDAESKQEKDSSAAAIVVCGLLEMVKHLSDEKEKEYYFNAANLLLSSLVTNFVGPINIKYFLFSTRHKIEANTHIFS